MLPDIKFASKWRKLNGRASLFQYLKVSNNVMHVAVKAEPVVSKYRALLYRHCPPLKLATSPFLAAANLEATKGREAHYRLHTKHDGKILLFGTGNCILAGKKTTSSACLSSARLVHMLLHTLPIKYCLWPSHYSCPNMVISGQILGRVAPTIKTDVENVNYSSKFPGIALKVDEEKVTPELFLARGKIIIPGVTSVEQLIRSVKQIETIIQPHLVPDETVQEATT